MNIALKSLALGALASLTLTGCGGGGGGGGSPTFSTGGDSGDGSGGGTGAGIDRLGVTVGTVTGFGSIFVNGVRYETGSADFDIDDDDVSSSEDDLQVGDIVLVTYDPSVASNIATSVFSDDAVEGPINSIDAAAGQLVVAGQLVLVDSATSFDDDIPTGSLDGLNVDDFVEVNGLFDSDGAIRATRIEDGDGDVEVLGPVSNLDTDAQTFSINDLVVDYGAIPADIDDDFSGGSFGNGDFVEVKGSAFDGSGALLATEVEPDELGFVAGGELDLSDFDEVEFEVEGFITRFDSVTDFAVAGVSVTTNSDTEYENGTADDLALDVKVEVEGELNSDGVLVAEEIEFRREDDLEVIAIVDSVDAQADTLVLLGITVRVDSLTRFEDNSEADLEPFSLFDINVGDYVEVRGSEDPDNATQILAGLLVREDQPEVAGEETVLQGFVEEISEPEFTILGVTVQTNAETEFDDGADDAGSFFGSLNPGDLIEVEGLQNGPTTILADEVEFED